MTACLNDLQQGGPITRRAAYDAGDFKTVLMYLHESGNKEKKVSSVKKEEEKKQFHAKGLLPLEARLYRETN